MSKFDLEVSASIIEQLAYWLPRSSVRELVNNINNKFREEKKPFKMTFSHGTRKIRVKELKN